MIKIISGVYGYRSPDTGSVVPKTSKDEPFSLTPEQEERLVSIGVAEYVEPPEPVAAPGAPDTGAEPPNVGGDDTQPNAEKTADGGTQRSQEGEPGKDVDREQVEMLLDEMNAKELREYGKELGFTFKVGMTKAEMRDQIEAELASLTGDGGDDEAPPKFDAAEAVM